MLAEANENKLESRICLLYAAQLLRPANRENASHSGLTRTILFLGRKRVKSVYNLSLSLADLQSLKKLIKSGRKQS